MDHVCYKCGSPVESGAPFCPHCRAPQIRVPLADEAQATSSPSRDDTLSAHAGTSVQWSRALTAALVAGLVSALISFTIIGIAIGGALAVSLYRRHTVIDLTAGIGARIGALSGLFGFAFTAMMMAIRMTVLRTGPGLRAALLAKIQEVASQSQDPAIVDRFRSPEGLAVMVALSLIFFFVLFLVLSAIGGALAAALIRRKNQG